MRCFIAVWPPLTALDVLAALPRPASEAVHWTAAVQWHITLRFFGQLTEGEADAALTALTAAAASVREPVVARGGPGCRVLNRRLLVWPVAGLDGLAATVSAATAGLGRPPGGRPFTGHLTLARARPGADLRSGTPTWPGSETSWEVTAVHLVESLLHPEGARYRARAAVPLGRPRG